MGTKKALVIGIDKYKNPDWNLAGCTMDAAVMSGMLQDHFGFPSENIRMVLDDRATKKNIEQRIEWLVKDAKAGDVLVMFYAGHGSQVRDRNGDELDDQQDEILCPHDLDWDDPLTDDILNSYFKRVPKGANLTVIFDCCNSGTATRSLPKVEKEYRKVRYISPPLDIQHRSRGMQLDVRRIGEVVIKDNHILMSACTSYQQAQETHFEGRSRGAFSYNLGKALKRADWKITYREVHTDTMIRLKDNGFVQIPQLECPEEFLDKQFLAPFRV